MPQWGTQQAADSAVTAHDLAPSAIAPRGFRRRRPKRLSRPVVGVELDRSAIHLVRIAHQADNPRAITAARQIPIPAGTTLPSPEYEALLGTALQEFCSEHAKPLLYAALPLSAHLNVNHLLIPKIPQRQVPNAVYWTLKKESPFLDNDTIVDFEEEGLSTLDGLPRIVINGYAVPRPEVTTLQEMFTRLGYPLIGVVPLPCAMRNLVNVGWLPGVDETTVIMHIGNDDSRITILNQGRIALSRSIKSGLNAVLEPLSEPGGGDLDRDHALAALASVQTDPLQGTAPPPLSQSRGAEGANPQIEEDVALQRLRQAVRRLVSNIERTLEYYSGNLKAEGIDTIWVCGPIVSFQPLLDYMGGMLGCRLLAIDPLGAHGARAATAEDSTGHVPGYAFGPAAGTALAAAIPTPNLLHTQITETRQRAVNRANWWVVACCFVAALICLAGYHLLGLAVAGKTGQVRSLEQRLQSAGPEIDLAQVEALVSRAQNEHGAHQRFCREFLGVAVIHELLGLTPGRVRLLRLNAELCTIPEKPEAKGESKGTSTKRGGNGTQHAKEKLNSMRVEGVVSGGPQIAASHLASYMHDLDRSPLFGSPVLEDNAADQYEDNTLMRFTLRIPLGVH